MAQKYEVQYLTLSGGMTIPAVKAVCPVCKKLVLPTTFDTSTEPWTAHCGRGHSFEIDLREDS